MQAELTWDTVRVVRNDLADADLEVIPAGTAKVPARAPRPVRREESLPLPLPLGAPGPAPALKPVPAGVIRKDELPRAAWGELSERIFSSDQLKVEL